MENPCCSWAWRDLNDQRSIQAAISVQSFYIEPLQSCAVLSTSATFEIFLKFPDSLWQVVRESSQAESLRMRVAQLVPTCTAHPIDDEWS